MQPNADDRRFVSIPDVLYSHAPLNLTVGDLWWTDDGVYFIAAVHLTGVAASAASPIFAALVGGLTGGIATAITANDELKGALARAALLRKRDWSVPIDARYRERQQHSLFIPWSDYDGVTVSGATLTLRTRSKRALAFALKDAPSVQDVLQRLTSDRERVFFPEHYAAAGLTSQHPAPGPMIAALIDARQNPVFNEEELDAASRDRAYLDRFWEVLNGYPAVEQMAALRAVVMFCPASFRSALKPFVETRLASLEKEKPVAKWASIVLLVLFIVLAAAAALARRAGPEHGTAFGCSAAIALVLLLGAVVFLVGGRKERARLREFLA